MGGAYMKDVANTGAGAFDFLSYLIGSQASSAKAWMYEHVWHVVLQGHRLVVEALWLVGACSSGEANALESALWLVGACSSGEANA